MSTTTEAIVDTPRTYAQAWTPRWDGMGLEPEAVVDATFAQQLERELAQAKAYSQQVVVNITEEMNGLKAGNARLLRELEELRKDKARLDWLETLAGPGWVARWSTTGRGYRLHQCSTAPASQTARQAIDAAMEEA